MLFNSLHFVVFFPLVCLIFFNLPHRFRNWFLLVASYYFYVSWIPMYAFWILYFSVTDYYFGIQIAGAASRPRRKFFLALSLVSNLGLLFVYKYLPFVNESLRGVFQFVHLQYAVPPVHWILPIGISFHTFQTMGYAIDVYRGRTPPERNLGVFSLFVAFFPQLVAGPIERANNLVHQFHERHEFDFARAVDGLTLMLWGFFKKVVIADRLAVYVNHVYDSPRASSPEALIVATYFFAFQIFCDFSGYSDIAIGAAQVLGIRLMNNFDRPYGATSIREFWHRWHISLSTWFRDYLYIPLGGSRVPTARRYVNLFVVFLISGIWHGANWTFAVWGALHGVYMIVSDATAAFRAAWRVRLGWPQHARLHRVFAVLMTFHLVAFAWIFFRANSLADARTVIVRILALRSWHMTNVALEGFGEGDLLIAAGALLLLTAVHSFQRGRRVPELLIQRPVYASWALCYGLIFAIVLLGKFNSQQFIYFQF